MEHRIYVTRQLRNPEFASAPRSAGLQQLATLAAVEDQPAELTAEHAAAVVAVIADSAPFRDSFYAAARDLRVVARWGVGFDQVNVAAATRHQGDPMLLNCCRRAWRWNNGSSTGT